MNDAKPAQWHFIPTPFSFLFTLLASLCLVTGCTARENVIRREPLPQNTRVVESHGQFQYEVSPHANGFALAATEEITVETFDTDLVKELRVSYRPLMKGQHYFWHDVMMGKYLIPFGFGFHVVETHAREHRSVYRVLSPATFFLYPLIVYVGGTAFGLFIYSPINTFYAVLGKSHRGIWETYKKDPQPRYRKSLGYFAKIADTALSWFPIYPGFTKEFDVTETVLSEKKEEHSKQRARQRVPVADFSNIRVQVNSDPPQPLRIFGDTPVIPESAIERYAVDDTLNIALVRGDQRLVSRAFKGSDLGIEGIIPRVLPSEAPRLGVTCRVLVSPTSDLFGTAQERNVLLDVVNNGTVPAYELYYTIETTSDSNAPIFVLQYEEGHAIFTPVSPPHRIELAKRLRPGERLRSVARILIEDENAGTTIVVSDKTERASRRFQYADGSTELVEE